jgi:hypothetical protein
MDFATIDDLERSLRDADYLPDRGLSPPSSARA